MLDCGLDPKSLLTLMHFMLEALNDQRFWHFLISSVSSFQPFEISPSPSSIAGTSIGPEKEQRWNWPKSPLIQHVEQFILDSQSMGACTVAPTPSSHDVRPTSNSVPEQPGAKESLNSGWPTGSPDESFTKLKQPHEAFFMKRRALITSLWTIWVATILFQQTKS